MLDYKTIPDLSFFLSIERKLTDLHQTTDNKSLVSEETQVKEVGEDARQGPKIDGRRGENGETRRARRAYSRRADKRTGQVPETPRECCRTKRRPELSGSDSSYLKRGISSVK